MIEQTAQNKPKYAQKTLDAMTLVQAGLKPKEALKAVNYTDKISDRAVSAFNKKFRKHSLQAPAMVKLAHHAIKDCLTDQPIKQVVKKIGKEGQEIEITEEIAPTWSNKIAAASMVYDRVEPVIHKAENVSHHVIHPVDLSRYRNDELSTGSQIAEVIDISAT